MASAYLVIQKFYDSEKVEAEILNTESDAAIIRENGYMVGSSETFDDYDLYVDEFSTIEEAEQWKREALNA